MSEEAAFGMVLREKLAELDADEAREAWLANDPLERFRLATHAVLLSETGGMLPRAGHHAYSSKPEVESEPAIRQLDILS